MDTKEFTYELDGLSFTITLTDDNGVITASVNVTEGSADFNALYWGDNTAGNSDFEAFGGRDKSLNMSGAEGSTYGGNNVEWDGAAKLSSAGLGRKGTDKETFVEEGETTSFVLEGVTSLDDIDYLGVRATSTSTPEGSIKTIATPHDPEPETPGDDFPEWPQDISHVTLVFAQDGGDTNGDGYYTVKIDNWPDSGADRDLDNSIDAIMARLIAEDIFIFDDANLVGAVIKGGNEIGSDFFYYNDTVNGTDPDPLPTGIGFDLTGGGGNENPASALDASYDYDFIFI